MSELHHDRLRGLVARGELALVIEQLVAAPPPAFRNTILQLAARYRDLKRELIAGTQDPEVTSRTKNRLNRATLDLLDAMENGEPLAPESEAAQTIIQGKNIVAGNVSNVGGDFRVGDNQSHE